MFENRATEQEMIVAPSTGAQWEYARRQQNSVPAKLWNLKPFFLKDPYTSSYSSSSIEYSINICIFNAFSNAPDPGWMNTLMRFAEFDVDVIVASHNGNALDPLETGNKESLNKQIQFLQV